MQFFCVNLENANHANENVIKYNSVQKISKHPASNVGIKERHGESYHKVYAIEMRTLQLKLTGTKIKKRIPDLQDLNFVKQSLC